MAKQWRVEAVHRETGERRALEGPDPAALQQHAIHQDLQVTMVRPVFPSDADSPPAPDPSDTARASPERRTDDMRYLSEAVQRGVFRAGINLIIVLIGLQLIAGILIAFIIMANQ